MDMIELAGYGIPAALIARWREQQGVRLLPLQEQAVRDYALFGNGNLLVQAPTSSGKTFVGEMAATHAALRRRKTAYLLPLKALAEEKYHEFRAKYEPYGVRIIVCTRDHRSFDGAFDAASSILPWPYTKFGGWPCPVLNGCGNCRSWWRTNWRCCPMRNAARRLNCC